MLLLLFLSFFALCVEASTNKGGMLLWADSDDHRFSEPLRTLLGGDRSSFAKGVPITGLRGRSYVHVTPQELRAGVGKKDYVQTPDELFALAKDAGITLVVTLYRSNEFATFLSHVNGSLVETVCPDVIPHLEAAREDIQSGLRAARDAGLGVALTTSEQFLAMPCVVVDHIVAAFNMVSNSSRFIDCRLPTTISRTSKPRNLQRHLGPVAYECIISAFQAQPDYEWMLDDDATRRDPPPHWLGRFFTDGLLTLTASNDDSRLLTTSPFFDFTAIDSEESDFASS